MAFLSSSSSCPAVPHNNKKLCHLFFGKVPFIYQTDQWKCTCGTLCKQIIKLGLSNLLSHIKQRHPNYEEVFAIAQQANHVGAISDSVHVVTRTRGVSGQTTLVYLFDSHSTNVFKWLEWIIMDEHEFLFCEKELTQKNSNLKPISVKTLKKYLFKVVEVVEKKISVKVATVPLFALLFDGWTEDSTHFVGLFIVYPGKTPSHDPGLHLLAFAPLLDETNFTAVNHANFIKASLEWYSISLSHMFCLIGENCQTNKATADIIDVPLLGCCSHCFNLAVEAYLQPFLSLELDLVSQLMSKLGTLKQSGRLHLMTSLRPVKQNLTHWTGAPDMFARFERLLPAIDQEDEELSELIPSAAQKRNIRDCKQALEDFKSVTIELQRCNISIAETNLLFNSIIDSYEHFDLECFLGEHAHILHNRHLESAIIKIQSSKEDTLTCQELPFVKDLLIPTQYIDLPGEDEDNGLLFAGRVLKRQCLQSKKASSA